MKKNRMKLSIFVLSMVGLSACLSGCIAVAAVAIIAHVSGDNYTAVAIVPKPANEVYATAKQAIEDQDGVKIGKQNAKKLHIEAKSESKKVSVKIDIKAIDAESCEVKVAAHGDQKVDEAKALTNRVFDELCDILGVEHTLKEK